MQKQNCLLSYFLLISYIFILCSSQSGGVLSIQNNFKGNLKIIQSQGCKTTFINGTCQECQQGYLFNKQRKCLKMIENCGLFNLETGVCAQCNEGYQFIGGQCLVSQYIQVSDPGCKSWANYKCLQCSFKWFMDSNGMCQKIDDNCRNWNNSGYCLSCYDGYSLNLGICTFSQNNLASSNPLCKRFNGSICVECSYRAFFDNNGICKQIDRNCNTFNSLNGICITCYNGFVLTEGNCIFSNNFVLNDPLCKNFDTSGKNCLQCSFRSYKNQYGICTQVNPLCQTFDKGMCLSCYSGYTLINTQCTESKQQFLIYPTDVGCKRWNWPQKKCIQCSYRYSLDSQGKCLKVQDNCKVYDLITGKCLVCNNKIESQGKKYFLNKENQCIEVSPYCRTYDDTKGNCTSCYQGYLLTNGNCQVQVANQNKNFFTEGCSTFDIATNRCKSCQIDYFLTFGNLCMKKPFNCDTCHSDGKCAKCLEGFYLQNGLCIKYKILGCKNLSESYCTQCQKQYLLFDGKCINFDDLRKILYSNIQ